LREPFPSSYCVAKGARKKKEKALRCHRCHQRVVLGIVGATLLKLPISLFAFEPFEVVL
jgi:hypothetical protein